MAKKKKSPQATAPNQYKLILEINGQVLETSADSIVEALENLKPETVKGYVLIKVEKDAARAEMKITPLILRRLLINKTLRQIFEKRLNLALK